MPIRITLLVLIISLTSVTAGFGQVPPDRELVVGTKQTVPFAIKNADGSWRGISIELWQDIAERLGISYRYEERDLEGLLAGLRDSSLDVVAAALTVTAEREGRVDFSHPFYTTGLSIAVASSGDSGWLGLLSRLVSADFMVAVGGLLVLLVLVGLIVYFFERRANPEQFGGSFLEGIGSGLWWSAVTMTTVGYGDKAPRTLLGRLVGLVWMFAAIIVVSGFTATIASSLTVSRLESKVSGPRDLPYVQVGSIANSTSAGYLEEQSISFTGYATPLKGLKAVARGDIEAFVYDAPIIRYLAKSQLAERVQILPAIFRRQDYALGLPQDSPLREIINKALLHEIKTTEWENTIERYLGAE